MIAESPDNIQETIKAFILRAVSLNELKNDDNLFESGIVNSLFAVQLMTFLEKKFDIEVTAEDLDIDNFKSVDAAAAFIVRKTSGRSV